MLGEEGVMLWGRELFGYAGGSTRGMRRIYSSGSCPNLNVHPQRQLGGLSLASIVYDLVDGKLPVRQRQADRSGRKAVRTQQSDLTT